MNILSGTVGVSEVLNVNPMTWYMKNFSDFKKLITSDVNILSILNWGVHNGVNKSRLSLALTIIRPDTESDFWENEFIIKVSNIKSFQKFLNIEDSEVGPLLLSFEREEKLNDLGIS
jgi:hypothetical protein